MTPPAAAPRHCTILLSDGLTERDVAAVAAAVAQAHGIDILAGAYFQNCVCTSLDGERVLENWLCPEGTGTAAASAPWPAALSEAGYDLSILFDEAPPPVLPSSAFSPFVRCASRNELHADIPASAVASAVIVALRNVGPDQSKLIAGLLDDRIEAVGASGHLIAIAALAPANRAFSTAPNLASPLLICCDSVAPFRAGYAYPAAAAARLLGALCRGSATARAGPIDVGDAAAESDSPPAIVSGADAGWQAWAATALFEAPPGTQVEFAAAVASDARVLSFDCDGRCHVEAQRRSPAGAWRRAEDPAGFRELYAALDQIRPAEAIPEPPAELRTALIDLRYML